MRPRQAGQRAGHGNGAVRARQDTPEIRQEDRRRRDRLADLGPDRVHEGRCESGRRREPEDVAARREARHEGAECRDGHVREDVRRAPPPAPLLRFPDRLLARPAEARGERPTPKKTQRER